MVHLLGSDETISLDALLAVRIALELGCSGRPPARAGVEHPLPVAEQVLAPARGPLVLEASAMGNELGARLLSARTKSAKHFIS